jgi:putative endonuclease
MTGFCGLTVFLELFAVWDKSYFVYILCCNSRRLYVGVTNNLMRRVYEHKSKLIAGFTKRYNIDQLVYYEQHGEIVNAIAREKRIKNWPRIKKLALIERLNPRWTDLAGELLSGGGVLCLEDLAQNDSALIKGIPFEDKRNDNV